MSDNKETKQDWAPERIWLQRGVGDESKHTWCSDSQDEHEQAEYVRVDVQVPAVEAGARDEKAAHLKTLDDAIRCVAEAADSIKAGCACDDDWPDADDKRYYDAQVDCLTRLRSMRAALARASEAAAGEPDISSMVNRFLGWKLPQDFAPDAGISFNPPADPDWWPTGTNLFHAEQARQMFEYATSHHVGGNLKLQSSIADHLFIDQRDDGSWLVCVEKVHDNEDAAREACLKWKAVLAAPQPANEQRTVDRTPPFSNCRFHECDLPGQCRAEGKCHHPASEQQAIDLAGALEQQRALAIVAAVRAQGFAKSNSDLPTQAESVFDLACEEIEHRLRTEVWALDGIPAPLPGEQQAEPIAALVAEHAKLLDQNDYAYFELAYTRQTGWMAWLTDRPARGEPGTAEYAKSRKVIARGQGDTAQEACQDALNILAAKGDGQ